MHRLLTLLAVLATARAHMSPFLPSMYGGPLDYPDLQNPVIPLGPGLEFDNWWFRGPAVRNAPPKGGEVAVLPAGGEFTLEIACAPEYTTYDGSDPNGNVACDDPGPYHADPDALVVDPAYVAGCAIGIADVTDPNDATLDDFVIISVQADCVRTRNTTFSIPAKMPSCTGDWCVCGWVWGPQTGIANGYHTPFRCKVTGSPADAQPIAPANDPVYCPDSREDCTKGAKKMINTYNYPVNVPFTSNYDRPGYHDTFGFFDGAQDDIFVTPVASSSVPPSKTSTSVHPPSTSLVGPVPPSSSSASKAMATRSSTQPPGATTTSSSASRSTTSSSSKVVWTVVHSTTTTRPRKSPVSTVSRSSSTSSTTSSPATSIRHSYRVPFRDRTTTPSPSPTRLHGIPFASRLSALPITTITPSSPRIPATRKTIKQRQAEMSAKFEKKGVSHPCKKRRRSFGDPDGGLADRLVDKMKKIVSYDNHERVREGKLVWTRVEL